MSEFLIFIYIAVSLSQTRSMYLVMKDAAPNPLFTSFVVSLFWPAYWFHLSVKAVDKLLRESQ